MAYDRTAVHTMAMPELWEVKVHDQYAGTHRMVGPFLSHQEALAESSRRTNPGGLTMAHCRKLPNYTAATWPSKTI